jgi:hypothetical protein
MKDRPFLILAVTTVILVIAAWVATVQRLPETVLERRILYPDLLAGINDVARLEISSKDEHTTLRQEDGRWIIENRGGYPAMFEEIKRTLVNVADLKVREGKTSKPELYSKLSVEDLDQPDAQSIRLTLQDDAGEVLADLLVGKQPTSTANRDLASLYVRPVGQKQALLVDGELRVSADPSDWLDNNLLNIDASRLATMRIKHPTGEEVVIEKPDPVATDYDLAGIPEGKEVKSKSLLNSQMTVLSDLRFDDVFPAADLDFPESTAIQSRLQAFDGLIVKVETADTDVGTLSRFSFSAEPGLQRDTESSQDGERGIEDKHKSVADEVSELNERVSGWLYKLPEFQVKKLSRTTDELLKDESQAPTAATPSSLEQDPQQQPPHLQ